MSPGDKPMSLDKYHDKRTFEATPEPIGDDKASAGVNSSAEGSRIFVVQKHAARSLHYDFRLEVGGVLASWAVPKGPSLDPKDKRLAVHVEDHPLEYASFAGVIPEGQYGAGTVEIWDSGTYEPLGDFDAALADRKALKFVLHGERLRGGFTLVPMKARGNERGDNWLLIKERGDPAVPVELQLATLAAEAPSGPEWIHEIKYDGYRLQAIKNGDAVTMLTRNNLDWTAKFPRIASAIAKLPAHTAVLDGEAVVFDSRGISAFAALQQALGEGDSAAIVYVAFELLFLDGRDIRDLPLRQRKELLQELFGATGTGGGLLLAEHVESPGPHFYREACALSLEGIVSKRADRPHTPGRSRDWLKVKCSMQERFIIGGYTMPAGSRTGFGALLLGETEPGETGKLHFAGRVGTGFSESDLRDLRARLDALATDTSPFAEPLGKRMPPVQWVRPELVAEVKFAEWTAEGHLRHPSFVRLVEPAKRPRVTNPDKVLWAPADRALAPVTKADLLGYYEQVSSHLLPELIGRPLTLVRCPHGLLGSCFYQKHPHPRGFPDSVRKIDVLEHGERRVYMHVDSLEGLLALAQLGVIEFHTWNSTAENLTNPDRVIFDLDPGPGVSWQSVCEAAWEMREALNLLGLPAFPKTTGGRGLHLVVPIVPAFDYGAIREFAKAFAKQFATDFPNRFTEKTAKRERDGRILIDYLRNASGATAVATYSARARPGLPVSVKIAWEEVSPELDPAAFDIRTTRSRLDQQGKDPWEGYAPSNKLADLLGGGLGQILTDHQP